MTRTQRGPTNFLHVAIERRPGVHGEATSAVQDDTPRFGDQPVGVAADDVLLKRAKGQV